MLEYLKTSLTPKKIECVPIYERKIQSERAQKEMDKSFRKRKHIGNIWRDFCLKSTGERMWELEIKRYSQSKIPRETRLTAYY